jgi:hypothetical protein
VFAVIAGLLFAIPWASGVAGSLAGDAGARPMLWHELHAIAGIGFALSLLELRQRYRGWFGAPGRTLLVLAVASALAFALANGAEVLGFGGPFIPLYGVSLIALTAGLIGVAVTTRTLPPPLPLLLAVTGIALPAALLIAAIPPPAGVIVGTVALMAYGLLWAALGFVQLSRNP